MFSKKIMILTFAMAFLLVGGLSYLKEISYEKEVLIESEESKTLDLTSVYNKIKWISFPDKDVWMMNQSHYGVYAEKGKWERLAIVVNKTKKPMTAKYYQIENGPLEWDDSLINKRSAYRASCFNCHNNGPRAIRPMLKSKNANLGVKEKLQIFLLNMRIKTYGRIHYDPTHDKEDLTMETPFHHEGVNENAELKVKTCVYCHNEAGFLSRGFLRRQQRGTIKSLVEKGHMPPPGLFLSMKEKRELKDFLRGF
ncbi:MAG: hypothetical protein K2Q18_07180 [Bdellovibrionales bacterium]|nr:hypothetical protein [Bdellovibrionales bacterium]